MMCVTQFFQLLLSFFFNDTATTEIYTLSLHDALPISDAGCHDMADSSTPLLGSPVPARFMAGAHDRSRCPRAADRKSTRLNSSHVEISYAVFCLKKKNKKNDEEIRTILQFTHVDNVLL